MTTTKYNLLLPSPSPLPGMCGQLPDCLERENVRIRSLSVSAPVKTFGASLSRLDRHQPVNSGLRSGIPYRREPLTEVRFVRSSPGVRRLIVACCLLWPLMAAAADSSYKPKRINKAIELLEQKQPTYYTYGAGGYEEGKALAKTWADIILYDLEHAPLDLTSLRRFMQGLVDGGPTPSGHRTPTVICTLPILGLDADTMKAGGWVAEQILAAGVHGLHLCRARTPEAVRAYVQAVRYPFQKQAVGEGLEEGLRGFGSQRFASKIWGLDEQEYLKKADVWPLSPEGEILLGIKIEDRHCLLNTEATTRVPGIAFVDWGPRDMGFSFGFREGRADPPLPKILEDARQRVYAACKVVKLAILDNVLPDNVEQRLGEGVMICAGGNKEAAEKGRRYTKREMPW